MPAASHTIHLDKGLSAVVDEGDHARIAAFQWRARLAHKRWFAVRSERQADGKYKLVLMHHEVLGNPELPIVVFKNGNSLDCRRANLRPATRAQLAYSRPVNPRSESGFKGVFRNGEGWTAQITVKGKGRYLGTFNTAQEAAWAYNQAANAQGGKLARLNKVGATRSATRRGWKLKVAASGFTGVYSYDAGGRFQSLIWMDGKLIAFGTPEEAAHAVLNSL